MAKKINATSDVAIGSTIRALREKKYPGHGGQLRCAKDFGTFQSEWSHWERGIKTPSAKTLIRLATFFEVSVSVLCGEPEAAPAPLEDDHAALLRLFHLNLEIQKKITSRLDNAIDNARALQQAVALLEAVNASLDG